MNESQTELPMSNEPWASPKRKSFFHFWRCFWLTFLVVSLAYAWYCFYVPSNSVAWAEDFTAAQQQAFESDKPMIIFFSGEWCVPCRIMKRTVWADSEVSTAVNAAFVPVAIDVASPDATEPKRRYGVGATPNTIITDPEGNVLQQHQGGMDKTAFLEMLDRANTPAEENL